QLDDVLHREHHAETSQLVVQPRLWIVVRIGAIPEDRALIPDGPGIEHDESGFLAQTDTIDDPFRPRLSVAEPRFVVVGEHAEHRRSESAGGEDLRTGFCN